jgi:formate hydrogenlyase subunit 4
MFTRILFNLFQAVTVLAFAPLVSGVLSSLKEMVQSKRGPSIFQPYWDLWKLFHKDEIVSEESSWIFRFTPYIVFVTPIFVALLIHGAQEPAAEKAADLLRELQPLHLFDAGHSGLGRAHTGLDCG